MIIVKIDKKGIDWLKNNLNIYLKYMVIEEQEFLKIINKLNNANIENLIELKEQIENYFLKIIYQNIKEDNFNFINNLINDKIKIRYKFQNIESLKRLVKILNKFKISHNIDFALKLVKENLIVKELISIIVNIFDNNLELIEKRLDDFDCFTYIIAYYLNNDLKTSLKYDFENSISEDSIENNMQEIKKIVLKEWQDPNINSDLIQSGIIGFLESYENFKNKNIPNFSLYAYWWIKKSIIIEKCQNECFFSNSYQINQQLKEYLELKDKLLLLLKKEPTIEDLVLNTNYSKKEILIFTIIGAIVAGAVGAGIVFLVKNRKRRKF